MYVWLMCGCIVVGQERCGRDHYQHDHIHTLNHPTQCIPCDGTHQGLAVGGAEAVEHEGDAGDVVVGGADEGEKALRWVLPVFFGWVGVIWWWDC